MDVYKHPLYYEIAFSFIDVKKQIDAFEEIIEKFSERKVRRVLDIACGPSLQLRELARRGYEAVGLDTASEMLAYLSDRAKEELLRIETIQADMCAFRLKPKVDFAFIMMGSLVTDSDAKLLGHLESVAGALNSGGLYLIQNKAAHLSNNEQRWTIERAGITVDTTFSTCWRDEVDQIYTERLTLDVDDNGKTIRLESKEDLRFDSPRQFKTLVALNNKFEFLGWWEGGESRWFLKKPLEKAKNPSNTNLVLLRKN